MKMKKNIVKIPLILLVATLFAACSTTENIPDGDQLFVGLTKIGFDRNDSINTAAAKKNFIIAQEEIEAALATAPNGALFGSSYHRSPFPIRLWIWNEFADKDDKFSQWMTRSFGKKPVLMSWVNPALRAQVAQSVLRNHGYFHGTVDYNVITRSNPKKAKIGYQVTTGPLLTIDSVSYVGFSPRADSLIRQTADQSLLKSGNAFTVASLDGERTRISTLFRNSGYFHYQPNYTTYLADTTTVPGRAQLRMQMADNIPAEAHRPYGIGNITVNLRKTFMQQLTDSVSRRSFKLKFNGSKSPVRPRVVMGAMRLRSHQPYSYEGYLQTANALNATGLFAMTDFQFTPRPDEDTIDVAINCVFDRPYDFYVETNFTKRTIGRAGPELKLGLAKKNLFKGAEKLDINLHGSYEWQTSGTSSDMSTYEYGADISLEFPRLVAPFMGGNQMRRRFERAREQGKTLSLDPLRWRRISTTLAKVSSDIVRRPGYYKMHVVSGEWTYRWQPTATSRHEFSPLTVKYQFMNSHTEKFDSIAAANPYLLATMQDYFIPQMRYTYIYSSPATKLNPIRWETTFAESGNLVSLGYLAAGRKWNELDKKLFKNPYSQFLKLETDFVKTWRLTNSSSLVAHVNAGYIWVYGNSDWLPNSEMFYVGGANSIRAFPVRGIGPGAMESFGDRAFDYLLRNGSIKFVFNLEYRAQLFGNLHGAIFLDSGNVWTPPGDSYDDPDIDELFSPGNFKLRNFFRQQAVGTGVGLRYDLDFLILRLDWGLALHLPYKTSKSGIYNIDNFKDSHTLHFAIGYPF